MPCYEVRTISVEFKAENEDLLDRAIQATGMNTRLISNGRYLLDDGAIRLDLAAGTAEVREGQQGRLNELKQAYSREAVKAATKKCQWGCKLQGNKAQITKMRW